MAEIPRPGDAAADRWGRRARTWSREPVGRGAVAALGVLMLAAPFWLWADPFDGYAPRSAFEVGWFARLARLVEPAGDPWLISDDFDYAAGSRTPGDLRRSLWVPHNSHVVPLFRLWTYGWVRAAGTLARLPGTFLLASLATYATAMLLVGRLVARESGRPTLGLASMAAFGVSATLEPTVRWYSAGQAIAAAVVILGMLALLQGWRERGGRWRLLGAALAAVAAPLVWTVGLVAGPVGAAYLWFDGRPAARRAALVPLAATAAVAALVFAVAGREVTAAKNFHGRELAKAADPIQGAMSTAQAIVEVGALRSLGLAAETTFPQAAALLALLGIAWARGRGRPARPNSLEAAGATMAVLGSLLVYTARGYYPYEQLRDLHWYHAAPDVGAILAAAGWWVGRRDGPPPVRAGATRGGVLAVAGILVVAVTLQTPRVRDVTVASVPPLVGSEREKIPTPILQHLRARVLRAERSARQRRDFARLDLAEERARAKGWGRATIRRAFAGAALPRISINMPGAPGFDPVALLALPEAGPDAPPAAVRSALGALLQPEPEPRPDWLEPGDPWPPPRDGGG